MVCGAPPGCTVATSAVLFLVECTNTTCSACTESILIPRKGPGIGTSRLIVSPSFAPFHESRNKKQKNDFRNTPLVMFKNWPSPWPQCARLCSVSVNVDVLSRVNSNLSHDRQVVCDCKRVQFRNLNHNLLETKSNWVSLFVQFVVNLVEYRIYWRNTVYHVSASHRRIFKKPLCFIFQRPKLRAQTERKKRKCLLSNASTLFHRHTCECAGKHNISQLVKLQRQIKIKMSVKSGGNKNDNDYFSDR